MSQFLSLWWNWGIASSEVITSTVLCLIVLITNWKFSEKKFIKPALYALGALVSIILGLGVGNTINPGSATAFGLLPIALIKSVYYQKYNALAMIIGMQVIGIIIGYVLYRLFVFTSKQYNKDIHSYEKGLVRLNDSYKGYALKELLAQLIFIAALTFMTVWSEYLNISSPFIMSLLNMLVLIAMIFVMLVLFESMNYFMFSPLFFIPTMISLKATKKEYINLLIGTAIQISFAFGISNIEYAIREVK